jgi:hypothetical protein
MHVPQRTGSNAKAAFLTQGFDFGVGWTSPFLPLLEITRRVPNGQQLPIWLAAAVHSLAASRIGHAT